MRNKLLLQIFITKKATHFRRWLHVAFAPPAVLFPNQLIEDARKLYDITELLFSPNIVELKRYNPLHPII